MRIPHEALVLVADGRQMILLRNTGTPDEPRLEEQDREVHANPANRDQKTDAAGRAMSMQSGAGAPRVAQGGSMQAGSPQGGGEGGQFAPTRGSAMEETDFHQQEEDRFAGKIAARFNREAVAGTLGPLVVVAAPRTLGELRKHWEPKARALILAEFDKDLVGQDARQITEALARLP